MHSLHFPPFVVNTTIPRYVSKTAEPLESIILTRGMQTNFLGAGQSPFCSVSHLCLQIPFPFMVEKNVNNCFCNLCTKFYSPPNSPTGPSLREMWAWTVTGRHSCCWMETWEDADFCSGSRQGCRHCPRRGGDERITLPWPSISELKAGRV